MFEGTYDYGEIGDSHWDVTPDGEHFVMVRLEDEARPGKINVVLNWTEELRRLVVADN